MRNWILQAGILALASVTAGIVAGAALLQGHRAQAKIEVESARSELELALATLSVRMGSMATAMERSSSLSPEIYSGIYSDTVRSATRVHERALAFMPEVSSIESAASFVERLTPEYAAAGYPEFKVFPEEEAAALFPVVLVEPPESRANVFGYNIGASPERLAAAREAIGRGFMTASAPVALSQDTDLSRASFLLLYPVYLRGLQGPAGASQAVIAAGVTPSDLFGNYVTLDERHVIEIEMGVAGVDLPVTLGRDVALTSFVRISLAQDVTLPSIRMPGFEVPFRASSFYLPRASDALWPVLAALLTAVIGMLIMKVMSSREEAKRSLEVALAKKEGELREAHRIQARSQRVEALGRLVGGVAHDFNNILSVILGNLELMKEEDADRRAAPRIDEAIGVTLRGAHLTRQLLSVGRQSHLQPRPIVVADALNESARMLRRVLPESIEIATVPAAGLWRIEVDPDGLQNALLNLALNARDALDDRGKLMIEASNMRVTEDYLDYRPDEEIDPGRYVVISVTDTGPGMAPEVADRAFEPFFTTKHMTDGSGLGLPSVLGFCRQSGGTCRIYTELGVGTTVRMYFPAAESEGEVEHVDEAASEASSGVGRILLAEDEDGVAAVLVKHLENAGYVVRRVPTGDAAWAEIESGASYDLLISDLVMPGNIQGADLARRVEVHCVGMAILLLSGYPQEAAIAGNGVATRHPILTKPVLRADLLQAIGRLLK